MDLAGWESLEYYPLSASNLKVTDINVVYLAGLQKLLVKVYSSADSAVLEGIDIRVAAR